MRGCVVNLVGHGSCILGHGSVFVWVSGSWVTACDPLSTLLCMSVTSRSFIETARRIGLILGVGLPSSHPILCYKKIQVSGKIRVLFSGTFS